MSNFIVTYDLNGPRPTHAQIDSHLLALGQDFVRGRILESVWYVGGPTTTVFLRAFDPPSKEKRWTLLQKPNLPEFVWSLPLQTLKAPKLQRRSSQV